MFQVKTGVWEQKVKEILQGIADLNMLIMEEIPKKEHLEETGR